MQNKQIKLISKSKNFIAKHILSGPIVIESNAVNYCPVIGILTSYEDIM